MCDIIEKKKFKVVLVAYGNREVSFLRSYFSRKKINCTVIYDRGGLIFRDYGVFAVPTLVIIDRAGKVAKVKIGGFRIRDSFLRELDQIFKR